MNKILLICIILGLLTYLLPKVKGPSGGQHGGISPITLAHQIFKKYDVNKDAVLDVDSESFLRQRHQNSDGSLVLKTESRGLLFSDADAFGNNDGNTTKPELEKYLLEFDTNNDGEINNATHIFDFSKKEGEYFNEKYEERYKYEEIRSE